MEYTIKQLKEIRSKIAESSSILADAIIMSSALARKDILEEERKATLMHEVKRMNDMYEIMLTRQINITTIIRDILEQD